MNGNRPIRRAQLIGGFGVGAMMDLPNDESLMVAGLDAWPFASEETASEWLVQEERLCRRLGVKELRLPPDYRTGFGTPHPRKRIPAVRFPRWHYCPRCGHMKQVPLFDPVRRRCGGSGASVCRKVPRNKRPFLIPVRIVSACSRGHIQDFPFDEWVHGGHRTHHRLRYAALGSSASLGGVKIGCLECDNSRSLAGSMDYTSSSDGSLGKIGVYCRGSRPWFAENETRGGCGEALRTLQRGASNVYFPYTVSSIYLPLWADGVGRDVAKVLEDEFYWSFLTSGLIDGEHLDRKRVKSVAARVGVDPVALGAAVERKLKGQVPTESSDEDYRRAEYDAFIAGKGGEGHDLLVDVQDTGLYSEWIRKYVERVCLVRTLRETRALAGFTRILPAEGERDPRLQRPSTAGRKWLPASVVRGEGIFLEFRLSTLQAWMEQVAGVKARARALQRAYNLRRLERGQSHRAVTPKYLVLHTLAHLLIKQLSYDCGYGSASLRERLYCDTEPNTGAMQGILIYTASGDSEGTMGGLVRQGKPDRLESVFLEAVRAASWCSTDPVCIESSGQGTDNANLAACHSCALVSETSCEEGNRLLDRGMVVGTIRDRGIGFLSKLVSRM